MELYYFVFVIIIASILQGVTGFGSALIAAPLLLLFIDKTTNAVALSFVSIALNLFLFITIHHPLDKKSFYRLLLPSLIGLPVGILILNTLDIQTLRILVGLFSIIFAALLFSNIVQIKNKKWTAAFSGFFSGMLHTSMGIGGPPVVLLLASQNTEKDDLRKTLSLLFFIMSIVSIILFIATKNLTEEAVRFGLYGIPAAFVGAYIGDKISKKVSQKQFIWSVFILVSITIIVAIYGVFQN